MGCKIENRKLKEKLADTLRKLGKLEQENEALKVAIGQLTKGRKP